METRFHRCPIASSGPMRLSCCTTSCGFSVVVVITVTEVARRTEESNCSMDPSSFNALELQQLLNALWDKALEFRFLLHKPFSSCNRLPQARVRSLYCSADSEVSEAYSDLIVSSKKTLDSILELQQVYLL
ncbi:rRNA processing protein-like protein [Perilla frutescens var. frutescens]|nr:rRNA processing protein-like protein [Perilla frutescens var. frutescens]